MVPSQAQAGEAVYALAIIFGRLPHAPPLRAFAASFVEIIAESYANRADQLPLASPPPSAQTAHNPQNKLRAARRQRLAMPRDTLSTAHLMTEFDY